MSKQEKDTKNPSDTELTDQSQICGMIMPISSSESYTAQHWSDVKQILEAAISDAGFKANLVSDADDVGIIHNRIVKNLAENPIVVCDVSSKNPNVMFELGLRLAFDKATIIIKDELTTYNFDTSPIEHLTYPSDLHYHKIIEFKQKLIEKIAKTFEASKDSSYSTFLKHFVNYKVKLQEKEVDLQEFFSRKLDILTDAVNIMIRDKNDNSMTPIRSGVGPTILPFIKLYLNTLNEPQHFFSRTMDEQVNIILSNFRHETPSLFASYPAGVIADSISRILRVEKKIFEKGVDS